MGKGDRDVRSRVVPGALTGTLSPLAECFNPERITNFSRKNMENTDMDLHRSLAMTGVGETEPPCINNIATMGLADSIETEQPVAVADVAEPGGPAVTGTGGPVEWEKKMRLAADRTGARWLTKWQDRGTGHARIRISIRKCNASQWTGRDRDRWSGRKYEGTE